MSEVSADLNGADEEFEELQTSSLDCLVPEPSTTEQQSEPAAELPQQPEQHSSQPEDDANVHQQPKEVAREVESAPPSEPAEVSPKTLEEPPQPATGDHEPQERPHSGSEHSTGSALGWFTVLRGQV